MTRVGSRRRPTKWGTRREVAMAAFGADSPKTAVARLNRWIAADGRMRRELRRRGYHARQRNFPPGVMNVFRRFGF